MANTIRESIIAELATVMGAYSWTAMTSPTVYRGRQVFDPDTEPPPLITILPRVEENEARDYAISEMVMPVEIVALALLGDANPSTLGEQILGEMIQSIFGYESAGEKVGGMGSTYADKIFYRSGGVDAYPDEIGKQVLSVGVEIEILYQTHVGNPYSNS